MINDMNRLSLTQKYLSFIFLQTFFVFCGMDLCMARTNVSDSLKYVGNPAIEQYPEKEKIYARNIYDMIEFGGKLYLGAGNSSNIGPSVSPGAAPVISYDPETNRFQQVFTTSEEQIDIFYKFGESLYIPGHDPMESWSLGNLYLSSDGTVWQKKRTIPEAIHTYCLRLYKDMLFAGLGTSKGAAVAISKDVGDSWQKFPFDRTSRIYDFMEVNGSLYAVGVILEDTYRQSLETGGNNLINEVFEYDVTGNFTVRNDITSRQLFPDTALDSTKLIKIKASHSLDNKSIYLGCYVHNDHQSLPFGLYVAKALEKNSISVKKVDLPEGAEPWDIYVSEEYLYLLVNKINDLKTEITVYRSKDLENWTELFYYNSPTLVRSFAHFKNTFYFSRGSETIDPYNWKSSELMEETGEIWKLDFTDPKVSSDIKTKVPDNFLLLSKQ